MPVTFDNVGSSTSTGPNLAFTLTLGSNAVLLVFTRADVVQAVSAVTYNGVALSLILNQNSVNELWGLTAPASGANTLSVAWTGAAAHFGAIGVSYVNVKNVNPWGTAQGTASVGTVINLSLSSTTTDLMVVGVGHNSGTNTINIDNAAATHRLSQTGAANAFKLEVGDLAGATTLSVSASCNASLAIRIIGVPLVFSAASVTSPFGLCLTSSGS